MSAIHGIASAVVPGMGSLIGGETKDGVKHMAINYVGAPAMAAVGAGLMALSADSVCVSKSFGKESAKQIKDELPKALKAIAKHPKATAVIGAGIALGGVALSIVNYIKSIVCAAKIEKK